MEKAWKKIYSGTNPINIEIIRQVLAEHEINAVIMNKQDSSYRFGQVELYVHGDYEAEALRVIEEMGNIDELPEA
jgi:hypothetical protein